ncbi:MAG: NAD-dependent epimerase/dehydratase family protein [candidate division KSB1 bacterium]|nr:NAD-dependent epimerase/dehydratase family protein [candidate division KSB1 bacterium]
MMKVLVTGSNGFIGSHLVEQLLGHGYHLKCLVRPTSDLKWIKHLPVQIVFGSITDFQSLLPAVTDVDYIYHLGGTLRSRDNNAYFAVNVEGTRNMLEACRQRQVHLKRFVYISSQAAAGPSEDGKALTEDDPSRPVSLYGQSKLQAEEVVLSYRQYFPVTILRPPVVFGPRDDDLLNIFKTIKWGLMPVVGTDEKLFSLIYVHDLVRGIHLAGEHAQAENEVFYLADAIAYSWLEIEAAIARTMAQKTITIHLPEAGLDLIANLNERLCRLLKREPMLNRDKALEMKQRGWQVDSSKAKQKLGFVTKYSLEQGLAETYRWYRQHGWL